MNWTPQPADDKRMPKVCAYVEIHEGSPEYIDATQRFKEKLGQSKVTITKVQRVQNPGEYMRNQSLKTSWETMHAMNVTERVLFHGTRKENIDIICATGFNRIFAADANGKNNDD